MASTKKIKFSKDKLEKLYERAKKRNHTLYFFDIYEFFPELQKDEEKFYKLLKRLEIKGIKIKKERSLLGEESAQNPGDIIEISIDSIQNYLR
ncbi:MAG: hypothetical protein K9M12_01380, partial [Candidatus Pacebacteria bacterium]|nr:hypothetical protein [Candidatus Paceibacterota bacterium]